MRYTTTLASFFLLFLVLPACAWTQNHLSIQIPTAEQETAYIWRTLRDIAFFEQHNYQLSLPQGPLMESLKQKAKTNTLTDEDYAALQDFVSSRVYQKEDYQQGYEKIIAQKGLVNKMIRRLNKHKRNWNFKRFDRYQIVLTLYGSGGNYNPDDGSIIIFTNQDGNFKQYDNPANTLIHEIVHMGIEESIIQRYQVSHPLKERIVDQLVLLHFKTLLPKYRLQDMGEYRIDPYLKKKRDCKNLGKIVEGIVSLSDEEVKK